MSKDIEIICEACKYSFDSSKELEVCMGGSILSQLWGSSRPGREVLPELEVL